MLFVWKKEEVFLKNLTSVLFVLFLFVLNALFLLLPLPLPPPPLLFYAFFVDCWRKREKKSENVKFCVGLKNKIRFGLGCVVGVLVLLLVLGVLSMMVEEQDNNKKKTFSLLFHKILTLFLFDLFFISLLEGVEYGRGFGRGKGGEGGGGDSVEWV